MKNRAQVLTTSAVALLAWVFKRTQALATSAMVLLALATSAMVLLALTTSALALLTLALLAWVFKRTQALTTSALTLLSWVFLKRTQGSQGTNVPSMKTLTRNIREFAFVASFLDSDDLLAFARARDEISDALCKVYRKPIYRPSDKCILSTLSMVQWALENGWAPPKSQTAIFIAARYAKSIAVLEWLRAKGYPWDEYAARGAARGGHLETLQWLRANGCP